jgi:MFS family permease
MRVWAGSTVSLVGDQVTLLALPWLVFQITHSAAQLGIVTALQGLPFLLFTLIAGVYADRWDRRIVMLTADLVRFVVLATVPLAWALHALTIWQLYAVAFIHGTGRVWFDVAQYALLPGIVRSEQLVDANSKFFTSEGASALLGPSAGGFLVKAFGAANALLADALSFVISALTIFTLPSLRAAERPAERGWRRQLAAGFRYMVSHRPILDNAWALSMFIFFDQLLTGVFVYYAQRSLHLDAALTGILFAIAGAGPLVFAPLTPLLVRRFRGGHLLLAVAFIGGPLMALYDVAPLLPRIPGLLLAGIAGAVGFGSGTVWNTITLSYRQSTIPGHLMTRVNSSLRFIGWGVGPIGALAGGLLTTAIGIRWVIAIGAAGLFAMFLAMLSFSELKRI